MPQDSPTVLAIDAGQTGVRARLDRDGVLGEVHEFAGVRTAEPLSAQLAQRALEVLSAEEVDPAGVAVAIGTSGVDSVERLADDLVAAFAAEGPAPRSLAVAHDSVSSYLGALGETPGVVVAAGTGSIIYGVGESATARVDGWGYLMGDDGSGFSIGARGWRAVMRAHDGRGPSTALLEDFAQDFDDLEGAYVQIQADLDRVRRMASYSRRVTAHAASDAVAREIAEWAGTELAQSVAVAAARVDLTGAVPVARLGRVLTDPTVDAAFEATLARRLPGAVLTEPAGSGLDGAALLPFLGAASALRAAAAYR
ncbi:MAG: hypothetical protein LBE25_04705 [Arthrobacter sp.]|jgi:N-acetylglucosamine kinase-like BadF-type ATPase|nr:hypothetical protein [Arthrobacter sp.]